MKHFLIPILFSLLLCSCNKGEKTNDSAVTKRAEEITVSKNTYAVVTSFDKVDKQKFIDHIETQTSQLDTLWQNGTIENLYYNANAKKVENQMIGSIIFFINAENENTAKEILDATDFVVNKIGKYELHPVGSLLFSRSPNPKMTQNVYACIWKMNKSAQKVDKKIIENQFNADKKLFDKGIIENAYINITTDSTKTQTSAVYFINADSEIEARKELDKSPLIQSKNAKYDLQYVGSFMRGKNK